jgi:membrane-associated phospholipid phosphatase
MAGKRTAPNLPAMRSRSSRVMLAAAGAAVLAAAAVWFAAFATDTGQRLDARALGHARATYGSRRYALANDAVRIADPLPFAVLGAGLLAIALARRRPQLACAAAVTLLAATVTTELLKELTADPERVALVPHTSITAASWPSGHTTAAAMLALWLPLVTPRALRPLAAVAGGAIVLVVAGSVLVVGWHFPSDVLGALCVAVAWTGAGLAALAASPARRTASSSPSR